VAVPPPEHSRPAGRATSLAVPVVAVAVLAAGASGVTPGPAALAIAVGGTGLWACLHLVRAALAMHRSDESYVACRGAGFVGLGALAAGLTAIAGLGAAIVSALKSVLGFGAVTLLYAQGTLLLPGIATRWGVLLRRAFDGIGLGVSLAFAGYLVPPVKSADPATLPITLLAATSKSIVTVTVLRSPGSVTNGVASEWSSAQR